MRFAEKLRLLIADQPFEFEGDVIGVTVSVGVATIEGGKIDLRDFLRQADENMYEAKRRGRNCVVG